MTLPAHIARAQESLLLEDMRSRCCEKCTGDNPVCDECAEINDGYQSCIGIGPEEIARRRAQEARSLIIWRAQ